MRKTVRDLGRLQLALIAMLFIVAIVAVAFWSPQGALLMGAAPVMFGMAIGQTSGIEKSVKCTAAIGTAFTIAKPGADDNTYSLAAGATDALLGIFQHPTSAVNDEVRIMLSGISPIKYGGTVTRGDGLTSDANGKAGKAVAGQNIIGYATVSGVLNDIGYCIISPQVLGANQGSDGLTLKGVLRVDYDFAVHGGAVGAIPLGVTLPNKAIIARAFGDIITAFTSTGGTGTIALGANTANDLLAAVDADTLSGRFDLIPTGTVATMVKATAAREITLTVATAAITAGKAVFFLEYVISD